MADNIEDDEKEIGKGHILEEFKEINEIKGLIDNLKDIFKDQVAVETTVERFTFIVDKYQEQPHLIDGHLESLMTQLLEIIRNPSSPNPLIHLTFKCLYFITKMRGAKVIVRLFPHEVADVEPVIALLTAQDPKDYENWETRYELLLWMSMVSMIPFDMVRLDSNVTSEDGKRRKPAMDRILDLAKLYLTVNDKSRDAAAYLASRFMTRPDVQREKLPDFLDWSLQMLHTANIETMMGVNCASGTLRVLSLLFKHGKREDLLKYAPVVKKKVEELKKKETNDTLLRKSVIKVIQRLGLTFLKNRVAAWRYQRGSRSLADNLSTTFDKNNSQQFVGVAKDDEDEEYDIPDEIEDVIEHLLGGLRDKDTIVRWSAAKGIGRITGRLPKELADEVVGSVLELFTIQESDGAWHGGCLSLAELGRRGLLLPQRLPDETKLSDIDILNIPDDYMYYSKIRKKCKRKSGGIVVMYRNKLKGYLNFINTDCEFVQWVKISKLIINQKTDSLLGCVYIPPTELEYSTSESFDEVENEMLNIKNIESLNCIIFGDFNAKTGSLPDYIIPDENLVDIFEFNSDEDILSYMFDYENLPRNSIPLHRVTSCNCAPNNYGRTQTFKFVKEFDIMEFDPLVSDVHCQLHVVIQAPVILYNSNDELSQFCSEKYVKWRKEKCSEFLDNVKSDHDCQLEQLLLELDNLEVQQGIHQNEMNKVVERISNFFQSVATKTFGKYKPFKNRKPKSDNKPWFNKQCFDSRKKFHKARKRVHVLTQCPVLCNERKEYFTPIKQLVTENSPPGTWELLFNNKLAVTQLVLDCTKYMKQLGFKEELILKLETFTRHFCFKLHYRRISLLKKLDG
ncbi:TBCD [Mytilus edulis]|uniref:TBCD n=1 Tax=Mytilus edulis TaxID=6550 RepID=A0A8S3R9D9_MYTED|nr:TBCD [Mytilus edulis]